MRHTYTPTVGEFLVGNQLEQHGWAVYLPARDVGVDLLAEHDGRFVRVQVKESRVYDTVANPEVSWTSWTQLRPAALRRAATQGVDWFVFVVHALKEDERRRGFEIFYVVIAPDELEQRLCAYHRAADRTVYWYRDSTGKLWELRGMTTRSPALVSRFPNVISRLTWTTGNRSRLQVNDAAGLPLCNDGRQAAGTIVETVEAADRRHTNRRRVPSAHYQPLLVALGRRPHEGYDTGHCVEVLPLPARTQPCPRLTVGSSSLAHH